MQLDESIDGLEECKLAWSAPEPVQDSVRTYVTAGSGSYSSCPAAGGHPSTSFREVPFECQNVLFMFADQRADFGRRRLALMCRLQMMCADGQFAFYSDLAAQVCCEALCDDVSYTSYNMAIISKEVRWDATIR